MTRCNLFRQKMPKQRQTSSPHMTSLSLETSTLGITGHDNFEAKLRFEVAEVFHTLCLRTRRPLTGVKIPKSEGKNPFLRLF